jgi:diguanylate cyclase (GGDEF)-like protein
VSAEVDTSAAFARSARDLAVARLHALTEITKAGTGSQSFDDSLHRTAAAARLALEAASLSISVWERDKARVRVLVNEGDLAPFEEPDPVDECYLITDYPFLDDLFASGRGYVAHVDTPPGAPGYERGLVDLLGALGKASSLSVPVILEGRVWGECFATRTAHQPPFTVEDLDYGTAVSAQVAAAVAQGQHLERAARLAYTDPLTGLANRRAIDDRLDLAMERHRGDGTVVSLVVVDVNGLKRINDDLGHAAGDRALVHIAGLLSASAGLVPGSLAGRTGGDEFCVIIEGAGPDEAVAVAEDLCRRASAGAADGVACGVASTGDPVGPVDSPARLFRLADAAQARAKRSRARRPVVAGRGLPSDATIRLADGDGRRPSPTAPRGDRRRIRARSHREVTRRLLDDVLEALDQAGSRSPRDRLEVVAETVARLVDAASWWVSITDADWTCLSTVSFSSIRITPGQTLESGGFGTGTTTYALSAYPVSAHMLTGRGAALYVDDLDAHPSERAIVEASGCVGLLMAGGSDRDGTGWLVEVYVDEISADIHGLASTLRVLVASAILDAPGP